MRTWVSTALLAGALCAASAAPAQVPPDLSIGGQMRAALSYGSSAGYCYVAQGASQFQRNGNSGSAVLSLPEVIYFDGTRYYPLSGQARLVFTSATTGNIKFKFWASEGAAISNPSFTGYSEFFDGTQYQVSFNVLFPGCTLPIFAGYENP